MSDDDALRRRMIGAALEAVTDLSRVLAGTRRRPFTGRALTRSQLDALFLIAHATMPLTPGGLAAALTVTPGAVTQLLGGLREAGLVEQLPNPLDARSSTLRLSAEADAEVERFEAAAVDDLATRFDGIDDRELRILTELLARTRTTM